jgi:HK97 family phage major capsid protein
MKGEPMADTKELDDKLDQLIKRGNEIGTELAGKADAARVEELGEESKRLAAEMQKIDEERKEAAAKAEHQELVKFMEQLKSDAERKPSKAASIGHLSGASPEEKAGNFFATVAKAGQGSAEAKAQLADMGAIWSDVPAESHGSLSKATLGTADGTGGYLIPNAVVADLIEHAAEINPMRQLLTVVNGVRGTQVEVPTEGLPPTRAGIIAWGDTKTNVNLTVNSYTATLYTLAVIADVSNQLLRHSEGAAEQLVRSSLSRRISMAEQYYIINGAGTTEPKGIITSIGGSGQFVTAHTASATTLAGSVSTAIAKAAGAVSGRNRNPDGVLLNPTGYWQMVAEGTDTAGFFFSPMNGPTGIRPGTLISPFGIPVYQSSQMPVDDLLVGDFSSAQLFVGDEFRVDTSTEAGDRWDKNLTGFRAEEEIGFNADPYVVQGQFQLVLDITA